MAKTKTRTRAKVVVNSKPRGVTASLQSKRTGLVVVLAFIAVGLGTLWWARAATSTYSLWSTRDVPKRMNNADSNSVELGVKFKSKYSGSVLGLRFYKGPQNTGAHIGNLWQFTDGRKLATVTFSNETASGWQTAYFAQPVNISANTEYVVSYFAPNGHYAVNEYYFTAARFSGPLTAARSGNGLYKYASSSTRPTHTYHASNYWVDVIYSTSRFIPTPLPNPPSNLQASLVAGSTSVNLSWQASTTTGVTGYEVLRGGAVVTTVIGTTYLDAGLSSGATYSYQVRAVDAGGKSNLSNTATITIPTAPSPTPPPSTGRPDATNTGVPVGTVLRDYTGPMENHDSNLTFDGVRFNGNDHRFFGDNLVFKNCEFKNSGVLFENNTTVRLERCKVNGQVSINNSQNVTILYNDIRIADDGLHVTTEVGFPVIKNLTFSHNYVHAPSLSCGAHADGVQLIGVDGFISTYNNIDMGKQFDLCGDTSPLNGTFQIKTDFTGVLNKNLTIDHNWLNGGGYTIRLYECGGTNKVTNNRLGRDWSFGPIDYPRPANCPLADKSGNVYDDNNAPISF